MKITSSLPSKLILLIILYSSSYTFAFAVQSNLCERNLQSLDPTISLACGGGGGGGGGGSTSYQYTDKVLIECESHGYKRTRCFIPHDMVVDVKKVKQLSRTTCNGKWSVHQYNLDLDYIYDYMMVERGCRARFELTLNQPVKVFHFVCNSINYNYKECNFPDVYQRGSVWQSQRYSDAPCDKDGATINTERYKDWGSLPDNYPLIVVPHNVHIWVNHGCRSKFSTLVY